ncbi:MAG: YfcC family protein, partial [Wenzhouxiangellaceae bacterium]
MTESPAMPDRKGFRMPDTLALMFMLMCAALVMTWILPAGSYEQVVNESGREVVVPGTYRHIEDAETLSPWSLFTAVPRAMADTQAIIFFVLLVGGAMSVIRQTGAIEAALGRVIQALDQHPLLLITTGVTIFAVTSATLGMGEEYIPLTGILIAMCVAMRMDT